MTKNYTKQLLDRITDTPCRSLALEFRIFPPLTPQPSFDEGLNMGREFLPAFCAGPLCKLSKSDQDRHTYKNIPRGLASLAEPHNVTLDRVADPGCPDSIDSGRANEITV